MAESFESLTLLLNERPINGTGVDGSTNLMWSASYDLFIYAIAPCQGLNTWASCVDPTQWWVLSKVENMCREAAKRQGKKYNFDAQGNDDPDAELGHRQNHSPQNAIGQHLHIVVRTL